MAENKSKPAGIKTKSTKVSVGDFLNKQNDIHQKLQDIDLKILKSILEKSLKNNQ